MKKSLPLKSFRLRNFKAVRDSGVVNFTPLTVFIGNNGSGKSSLIEGIETIQRIIEDDLDEAIREWGQFEQVWHQGVKHALRTIDDRGGTCHTNPMSFEFTGSFRNKSYRIFTEVNLGAGGSELFISHETFRFGKNLFVERDAYGTYNVTIEDDVPWPAGQARLKAKLASQPALPLDVSVVSYDYEEIVSSWQFLALNPSLMSRPYPQRRTPGTVAMLKDGANVAEYFLEIRKLDPVAFDAIVETLQHILPYARDLQPEFTSTLEREVFLQLVEKDFKVPSWLFSTGTLRILALLALLRHPNPPCVIFIEEIENGLDPRSIHLLVDEIRDAVESGRTQVVATTHSPYLLDLLHLSQIVLVERQDGEPVFIRPEGQKFLKEWSQKFGPGKLYTMDLLRQVSKR